MIKWEYTELRLPAPDPLEAYHTDHTKMLRDLGQCGWELVSAFPDPAQPGDTVMWFKRPVEDEPRTHQGAWHAGYDAACAGTTSTANPYQPAIDLYLVWHEGHQAGREVYKAHQASSGGNDAAFTSGPIVSYADLYEMAAQWREAAERESKDSHNPYFSDTERVISQGRAGVYTNLAKALEAKLTISKADANQAEDAPLDLDTLNILYGLLSPKTLAQMRIDMGTWEGEYAWLLRANLCSHIGGLDRTETEYQAYRDALRELG